MQLTPIIMSSLCCHLESDIKTHTSRLKKSFFPQSHHWTVPLPPQPPNIITSLHTTGLRNGIIQHSEEICNNVYLYVTCNNIFKRCNNILYNVQEQFDMLLLFITSFYLLLLLFICMSRCMCVGVCTGVKVAHLFSPPHTILLHS